MSPTAVALLERVPIAVVAAILLVINVLQRFWFRPPGESGAAATRPLFQLINSMCIVSTVCNCASAVLSCASADAQALTGSTLVVSELLRSTSSAALLCTVIAAEYQTLYSFSRFLRFKISSSSPPLPPWVLPLHWTIAVCTFLVAWLAVVLGALTDRFSYRGLFLLYLACTALFVLALLLAFSCYIFSRVASSSSSLAGGVAASPLGASNEASLLSHDSLTLGSSTQVASPQVAATVGSNGGRAWWCSLCSADRDPISRFRRFVAALAIVIPVGASFQIALAVEAFDKTDTWSPNSSPVLWSPLVCVTLVANVLAMWFVWVPFAADKPTRAGHTPSTRSSAQSRSTSIETYSSQYDGESDGDGESDASVVHRDGGGGNVIVTQKSPTLAPPQDIVVAVEQSASVLPTSSAIVAAAHVSSAVPAPRVRTAGIAIGGTETADVAQERRRLRAASTRTSGDSASGSIVGDGGDVRRPRSHRRQARADGDDGDEEESAAIGRVTRVSHARIEVLNAAAAADALQYRNQQVAMSAASISSSVLASSFLGANLSATSGVGSLVNESVMGASHGTSVGGTGMSLQFGGSLERDSHVRVPRTPQRLHYQPQHHYGHALPEEESDNDD